MGVVAYLFGPFRLDRHPKRLFRAGQVISLNPIRFEILQLLVERAGEIVTREEITRRIQAAGEIDEATIAQHIFHLRRILNDDPRTPDFILTIPGVGYLFYKSVRGLNDDGVIEIHAGLPHPVTALEAPPASTPAPEPPCLPASGPSHLFPVESSPGMVTILVLLSMMLTGLGIYLWTSPLIAWGESAEPGPTIIPGITSPGIKSDLALARNGRAIAFTSAGVGGDSLNLFLWQAEQNEAFRLTSNPHLEKMVTWSPDNQELAFLRWANSAGGKYDVITLPVQGGPERLVGRALDGLAWDPRGEYLAIADNERAGESTGIYLLSLDGRQRLPVSRPDPALNIFDHAPQFSPDGEEIVFIRSESGTNADLFIARRLGGGLRRLTADQTTIRSPHWLGNGKEILFVSDRSGNSRLWRISRQGGPPRLISNILGEIDKFSLAAEGGQLAYTTKNDDTNILVRALPRPPQSSGPGGLSLLTRRDACPGNSTRHDGSPQFSPDGARLAFVSNRSGFSEIWISDAACRRAEQLTNLRERNLGTPRWSPDGARIAFDRIVGEQSEIFTVDLIGGRIRQITRHPAMDAIPSWSADGKWIYFTSARSELGRSGQERIWRVPASGGNPEPVTEDRGRDAIESVDGRRLFFTRDDRLWSIEPGDPREKTAAVISELCQYRVGRHWALTPGAIYFVKPGMEGRTSLCRMDLASRQISSIIDFEGSLARDIPAIAVTRDERRVAVSLANHDQSSISLVFNWQ